MHSKTYLFIPGDLVVIRQNAWFTKVSNWTLSLAQKPLRGIFLGKLKEDSSKLHDFINPCRIVINGNEEVVVELSKINYYSKRRSYEKVN